MSLNEPLGPTHAIARFVHEAAFSDIPEEVVESVKLRVLDAIGITLAAYNANHVIIRGLLDIAGQSFPPRCGTAIGFGRQLTVPDAAMINSVMANLLDFSDGHFLGGHINDRLVPIALSAAEYADASGKDLLTALVVGYETYIALATMLFGATDQVSMRSPHFVILGALAGAMTAGRLLGLDAEQLRGALGLAASVQLLGAQYVLTGGHEKDLTVGHESRRAVFAALVAQKGILGSQDILEGERGILSALGVKNPGAVTLGLEYRIGECYFKPYPACRFLHASIDAAIQLRKELGTDAPADVKKITVRTTTSSSRRASRLITSHVHAIFSHPYQVVTTLIDGQPSLPIQWSEKVKHPLFEGLMRSTEVMVDPRYDRMTQVCSTSRPPWPARVEIAKRSGQTYSAEVLVPKGDPGNPLTRMEIEQKYISLTKCVLAPSRQTELADMVEHLEQQDHMAALMRLLSLE
jgi:2-methylcitrate dehydratase PrpD